MAVSARSVRQVMFNTELPHTLPANQELLGYGR